MRGVVLILTVRLPVMLSVNPMTSPAVVPGTVGLDDQLPAVLQFPLPLLIQLPLTANTGFEMEQNNEHRMAGDNDIKDSFFIFAAIPPMSVFFDMKDPQICNNKFL